MQRWLLTFSSRLPGLSGLSLKVRSIMPKIGAAALRDFADPISDNNLSPHGSQREDALIELYLPGWGREASVAAKVAFLPGVAPVAEGNGRGRGATLVDAFRVNPARGSGGDFVSLKAPSRAKDGGFATSIELFKGTKATLARALASIATNYRNGKAFPVVVVHSDGDTFAPVLVGWEIRDFGHMLVGVKNAEAWNLWNGVPVKPENDRIRGAAGSPASMWVQFFRRELLGYDKRGNPKVKYWPDHNGDYVGLTATFSKRSGATFGGGSAAKFAADVDAATVLRR